MTIQNSIAYLERIALRINPDAVQSKRLAQCSWAKRREMSVGIIRLSGLVMAGMIFGILSGLHAKNTSRHSCLADARSAFWGVVPA